MSTYCLDFALASDQSEIYGAVASTEELLHSVRSVTGRKIQQLEILCEGNHVLVTGVCRDLDTKRLVTQVIRSAEPGVLVQNEIGIRW